MNQSFAVTRIHFFAPCFDYFKQSGNHVHALSPHCESTAADDLKTQTDKLEFSDLNLWLLNKCTYSTAVVLVEQQAIAIWNYSGITWNFTVIIFFICFSCFHNVDGDLEIAYVFGINLYNKKPIINPYTEVKYAWGKRRESTFYWFVLTGESAITEMQKYISQMITIINLSKNLFLSV